MRHVLRKGSFFSVRCGHRVKFDARIIAATHHDLLDDSTKDNFRGDVLDLLNPVKVSLPPLRERNSDIPDLLNHFLEKHSEGKSPPELCQQTLDCLMSYDWPGNVLELENWVQRLVTLGISPL